MKCMIIGRALSTVLIFGGMLQAAHADAWVYPGYAAAERLRTLHGGETRRHPLRRFARRIHVHRRQG
jgi:hypothetical protein